MGTKKKFSFSGELIAGTLAVSAIFGGAAAYIHTEQAEKTARLDEMVQNQQRAKSCAAKKALLKSCGPQEEKAWANAEQDRKDVEAVMRGETNVPPAFTGF